MPVRAGEVIANRYRVEREAGTGGMGTVYAAFDLVRGTRVALKTWRVQSEPGRFRRSRPAREAEALKAVTHPAVVRFIELGDAAETGPFLVMDWVPGESLAERLEKNGLTPLASLRLLDRLASGLAAFHSVGVVHRDVKPGNIMLPSDEPEDAVLVDFGVARLTSVGGITQTGSHIGTPGYMAPEQIRSGRSVDGRADVFALGCVLLECLTGRPAFAGSDPIAVLARILFEPYPVPSQIRPDLPRALDELVALLLERDPARRPHSAQLAVLLARARAALESLELSAAAPADPVAAQSASPEGAVETLATGGFEDSTEFDYSGPPSFRPGRVQIASTFGRSLPPRQGGFFGRDRERAALAEMLALQQGCIGVWGGPGIGKTRLVVETIRGLVEAGRAPWDALVFCDLAAAEDADDVVRSVAREASVALLSSAAPEAAVGRTLSKLGRVLLVLDRIEHVATSLSAAMREWRRVAPQLVVVTTSRRRFMPLDGLALELGPLSLEPDDSGASAAAGLFLDRASQFLPELAQTAAVAGSKVAESAERLVGLLEGIPLAIELCAARVSVLGVDGLLSELSESSERRALLLRETMWETLEWSWKLLSASEQKALAALSVFRGGFSSRAAEHLLALPASEGRAARMLQSLRENSLLHSRASAAGDVRLWLFPAIHEFVWERAQDSPEFSELCRRHAAYYGGEFRSAHGAFDAGSLSRLELEAENLLAAAEFSLREDAGNISDGLECLVALEPAMLARGTTSSYVALLDRAIERTRALPEGSSEHRLSLRARQIRARLDAPNGLLPRARAALLGCLAEVGAGDVRMRGTLWLDLGVVHHLAHDLAEARRCYELSLDAISTTDDVISEARAVGNLGAVAHDEGNFLEAVRSYRSAIALLEQAGEERTRANFMGNLAVLEQELGNADSARSLYRAALGMLESVGDARLMGVVLGNFGVLEVELGNLSAAGPLFEQSHRLISGLADVRSHALSAARLAMCLSLAGRASEAEARLRRAMRLAAGADELTRDTVSLVHAFVELAWANDALARGAKQSAAANVRAAQALIDRASEPGAAGRAIRDQSDDARALLRILRPWLARTESAISNGNTPSSV